MTSEQSQRAADPGSAREIPLEVAVGLGVVEAEEGLVHLAEEPAEPGEQLRAAGAGLGERRPGEPREHPHEAGRAVRAGDGGRGVAAEGRDDTGQGQVRRPLGEVPERRALQLHEPSLALGVHGLQDEDPAVGGGDAEVVVELAGKGLRFRLEAVEAPGEENRVRRGEGVGGAALGQHGPDLSPKPARGRGPPGAPRASVLD